MTTYGIIRFAIFAEVRGCVVDIFDHAGYILTQIIQTIREFLCELISAAMSAPGSCLHGVRPLTFVLFPDQDPARRPLAQPATTSFRLLAFHNVQASIPTPLDRFQLLIVVSPLQQ